jgi:hypothetical protein
MGKTTTRPMMRFMRRKELSKGRGLIKMLIRCEVGIKVMWGMTVRGEVARVMMMTEF